jgi:hypothetical protein
MEKSGTGCENMTPPERGRDGAFRDTGAGLFSPYHTSFAPLCKKQTPGVKI